MNPSKFLLSTKFLFLYFVLIVKPSFERQDYDPNVDGTSTIRKTIHRRKAVSALKSTSTEYPNVHVDDIDGESSQNGHGTTTSTLSSLTSAVVADAGRPRQRKIATAVMTAVGLLVLITTLGVLALIIIVVRRRGDQSLADEDEDQEDDGKKRRRHKLKEDDDRHRKGNRDERSLRSPTGEKSPTTNDKESESERSTHSLKKTKTSSTSSHPTRQSRKKNSTIIDGGSHSSRDRTSSVGQRTLYKQLREQLDPSPSSSVTYRL